MNKKLRILLSAQKLAQQLENLPQPIQDIELLYSYVISIPAVLEQDPELAFYHAASVYGYLNSEFSYASRKTSAVLISSAYGLAIELDVYCGENRHPPDASCNTEG